MKRILVTGGLGFIGSNLANKLNKQGYDVTVFDKPKDLSVLDPGIKFSHGSLENKHSVNIAMDRIDCVVHLGAKARIPESNINPDEYFQSNVIGTKHISESAKANRVKRIVYAASSTYYGNQPTPQQPDMLAQPLNYYALTKAIGEQLLKLTPNAVDCTVLRLFTVYGPGQPLNKGDALVIGNFLRQTKERLPLTIDGTGQQTRDFVHIDDVTDAFVAAINSNHTNDTFNVGSGESISINNLASLFSNNIIRGPAREKYALHTKADISKTTAILDWKPKIDIIQGINRLLQGD